MELKTPCQATHAGVGRTAYNGGWMPRKSRFQLPVLDLGDETFGERLARFRKENGFTQAELAERIGIIHTLVSEYERDKLRMHTEMLARFAMALGVSSDELLGLKSQNGRKCQPSRRILRRLAEIESLPARLQATLLKTLDLLLKGARK